MTTPRQPIRIISERFITTTPAPGQVERKLAITYQLPPKPPSVVFVNEDDLPDLKWRRENPGQDQVPEEIQKRGDELRRRIIEREVARRPQRQSRIL